VFLISSHRGPTDITSRGLRVEAADLAVTVPRGRRCAPLTSFEERPLGLAPPIVTHGDRCRFMAPVARVEARAVALPSGMRTGPLPCAGARAPAMAVAVELRCRSRARRYVRRASSSFSCRVRPEEAIVRAVTCQTKSPQKPPQTHQHHLDGAPRPEPASYRAQMSKPTTPPRPRDLPQPEARAEYLIRFDAPVHLLCPNTGPDFAKAGSSTSPTRRARAQVVELSLWSIPGRGRVSRCRHDRISTTSSPRRAAARAHRGPRPRCAGDNDDDRRGVM